MILKDGPLRRFFGRLCGDNECQIQSRDPDFFQTCGTQKRTISSTSDGAMVLATVGNKHRLVSIGLARGKCSAKRLQSVQLRGYCGFRTPNWLHFSAKLLQIITVPWPIPGVPS